MTPGGGGSELGSTEPLTGGRSWNMKSHFQRSEGFDACSQWRAVTARANASAGSPANSGRDAYRAAMSARTCAALG